MVLGFKIIRAVFVLSAVLMPPLMPFMLFLFFMHVESLRLPKAPTTDDDTFFQPHQICTESTFFSVFNIYLLNTFKLKLF